MKSKHTDIKIRLDNTKNKHHQDQKTSFMNDNAIMCTI